MAITSTPVPREVLNLIILEDAKGTSDTNIAAQLNTAGHSVPREVPPADSFHNARYPHGYIVNNGTIPDQPYRWSGSAVAAVLAAEPVATVVAAGTSALATLSGGTTLTIE